MTGKYAASTSVAPERTRGEIERTLMRWSASHFLYGSSPEAAVVMFRMRERQVKIELPLPKLDDFRYTSQRRRRSESGQRDAFDQAVRQRWRALLLLIKARLEGIELGIESFDQAFLPYLSLPDGRTVGEFMIPQVEEAVATGAMPSGITLALPAGD